MDQEDLAPCYAFSLITDGNNTIDYVKHSMFFHTECAAINC